MVSDVIKYSCIAGKYKGIKDDRFYIPPSDKFKSDRMNAKAPKILPHLYLPQHEYSIWVDANIELLVPSERLIEMMGDSECMVFGHPFRQYIYEEVAACKGMDTPENLEYHRDNDGRLAACGVIVRKNTITCNEYNEMWWAEICRGSSRDQLSFPYTLGHISTYYYTEFEFPFNSKFTKWHPHK